MNFKVKIANRKEWIIFLIYNQTSLVYGRRDVVAPAFTRCPFIL